MKQEKLKYVHALLENKHIEEIWSEMEVLTFYKNIIFKKPGQKEMIEEDYDDIPEEKLNELIF